MTKRNPITQPTVAAVFAGYPRALRAKLMALRQLIFDVAAHTEGVGTLEETLKWGQPSYLTTESGSGSLIRIDQIKNAHSQYAMYFHCQTTLVATFRQRYRGEFTFAGNRALVFDVTAPMPIEALGHCVALALTYHRRKVPNPRHAAIPSMLPAHTTTNKR